MPRGGARPGAGRPRKRIKHTRKIAEAEKRIADRLPELINLQFELAEGVTVQETDSHGQEKIYRRPPDRQAIEYLVNRIMGKPVEKQEVTGENGNPIALDIEIRFGDEPDVESPDQVS